MALDVKSRAKRYEKLDFLGEGQIKLGHRSEAKDDKLTKYITMVFSPILLICFKTSTIQDLKPNNLLLDENGVLKLADFGLAKSFGSPNRAYTHQVVTRWYRAPELLFGARMYGVGVDMWAVGCILAELLLRVPFLPGDSDLDQLTRIFETLGTPTEEQWPDMCSLPDYVTFKSFPGIPLQHIFIAAGDDLLDLIQGLFLFNPCTRITATQALKTKYFSNRPGPTPGCQLPRPNCPVETLKEQSNPAMATKRKRTEALEQDVYANEY
ncbi:Cyclin-dependent kinase 7 [Sciurus carolinensis]|uniref:Cyclin-dependent kinase 7 n=1 Tax=Sciurus carolinensis TaxID=30640 RepID=A0AA41SW69_SCICA|nr:Cyclin-dependent kinase 7 [Sciurus carolinensis]